MPKDLQDLIQLLQSNNFKAECPNCNGNTDLSEIALFDAENFTLEAKGMLNAKNDFKKEPKLVLNNSEVKKLQIIETTNRSVNIGFKRT